MVIKAKGYIRNKFVAKSGKSHTLQIDDEELFARTKKKELRCYLYCGETVVARLKTEKSAMKLAADLNSRLSGISDC